MAGGGEGVAEVRFPADGPAADLPRSSFPEWEAALAVGRVLARNPLPLLRPCHRVVGKADLGGYRGGRELKRALLRQETGFFHSFGNQ